MSKFELFGTTTTVKEAWLLAGYIDGRFFWEFVVAAKTDDGLAPALASTNVTELVAFDPFAPTFSHYMHEVEDFIITATGGDSEGIDSITVKIHREQDSPEKELILLDCTALVLSTVEGCNTPFAVSCSLEFRGIWIFGPENPLSSDEAIIRRYFGPHAFHLSVNLGVNFGSKRFYNLDGATEHFKNGPILP